MQHKNTHDEFRKGSLSISTDPSRLDLDFIHGFLRRAYWSEGIPRDIVEQAIKFSLSFGVFDNSRQIGFGRVITDYATFGYLCDVFILEDYRGQGIGSWMISCIMSHPRLQGFRRWHLLTRDAHNLYRKSGFTDLKDPGRHMQMAHPDLYKELRTTGKNHGR